MKKQTFLHSSILVGPKMCAFIVIALLSVLNLRAQDPCNPTYPIAGLGQAYEQTFISGGAGAWNISLCGTTSPYLEKVYSFTVVSD